MPLSVKAALRASTNLVAMEIVLYNSKSWWVDGEEIPDIGIHDVLYDYDYDALGKMPTHSIPSPPRSPKASRS